jgi:uncharacterized membrane protein HdeD (DUF308 family)
LRAIAWPPWQVPTHAITPRKSSSAVPRQPTTREGKYGCCTVVKKTKTWWVPLFQGMVAVVLGGLLFADLGASLTASINYLGVYWLILGVLSLVQIYVDDSIAWLWSLLIGFLGVVAGIFVLNHPPLFVLIMPDLVLSPGVIALTIGMLEIIGGWTGGGIGPFVLGVINLLIGFLLLDPPLLMAVQAPLAFGALLLVQGVALLILAFRTRS